MRILKQSTAYNLSVFMTDSTDHITGKASLTLTITASKDGAAFASISPTVTDLGSGWYKLALTTAHTDTLGDLAIHITSTGADPTDLCCQVQLILTSVATILGKMPTNYVMGSSVLTDKDDEIDAIKAKTDNLPASPAAEGSVTARPTLAQIEASTVLAKDSTVAKEATLTTKIPTALSFTGANVNAEAKVTAAPTDMALNSTVAKEATLTGKASQASVDTIDTNIDTIVSKLPTNNIMGSSVKTDKDDEIDAIKAKTDNLPADPADESNILSAISGISGGTADWTADEKKQIRKALGVDGIKVDTSGGNINSILASVGTIEGTTNYNESRMDELHGKVDGMRNKDGNMTFDPATDSLEAIADMGPGGGGGGATAEEIRIEMDTNSTQLAAIKAKTDNLPTDPADQSILEGKIDIIDTVVDAVKAKTDNLPSDPASNTQVNTRLAASSYTAPDNASVTAIKAKTDNLPADPADESLLEAAIATRMAAASYTAPDNAGIAALPTLAEIEASSVLAKEATLAAVQSIVTDVLKLTGYKATVSGDTLTIYEANGVTVWRQYDLSNYGRVQI